MPDRRTLLKAAAGIAMIPRAVLAETAEPLSLPETALRVIPATGEKIPAVGMGSWLTFDVGDSAYERRVRVNVLQAFFEHGGGLIDFVQLTYNIVDREAERRILPLAQDLGIAVIVNRPFRQSRLFDPIRRQPRPSWARDIDCTGWAQLLLKYIVSHPAVTCAMPATGKVEHMLENMGALAGRMPNAAQRVAMGVYYASL
jgi:aryl-alcohol dehydrogenase-like predicted oxidoreductase